MLQQKKGWGKNVIVMYTCKDNLTPLLYSGEKKKKDYVKDTEAVIMSKQKEKKGEREKEGGREERMKGNFEDEI